MNYLTFSIINNKHLLCNTEDNSLTYHCTLCKFVLFRKSILSKGTNNGLVFQFNQNNHIRSTYNILSQWFRRIMRSCIDYSCLFCWDLFQSTDFMHNKVSLSFVEYVSLTKIHFIYHRPTSCVIRLSYSFFCWSFITSINHDCWSHWGNRTFHFIWSSNFRFLTSSLRKSGR